MFYRKRMLVLMTLVILLGVAAWSVAAGTLTDQRGVLAGTVLPQGLTTVGATVKEGTILVYVNTITGPAAAVRANTDGVVREVLVRAGEQIKSGDVLVRIESSKR